MMQITRDSFAMVAMKAYDNPSCKTLIEFEEDLAKFSNLVRLCSRGTTPIESHLMLNAVVTLLNVFEPNECVRMMFFKVKKNDWPKLKTVLVYLNRMPEKVHGIIEDTTEITLCQEMIDTFRLL